MKRMRYNVIASSTMLNADATRGGFRIEPVMITLTYQRVDQPRPEDVRTFIDHIRKWMKRRGETFRYAWVGELQKRGALHYHIVIWMPHGMRLPKPDVFRQLQRGPMGPGDIGPQPHTAWWPHGWSRIEKARNAVGYIAKYASKLKSSINYSGQTIPRGFRIFGIGGLDSEDRSKRSWCNLPGWLRDRTVPDDRCKRIIGGGWVERSTGDYWPSPFKVGRVTTIGGRTFVSIVPNLPEGTELCSPW